jgi:TPR repeat protein
MQSPKYRCRNGVIEMTSMTSGVSVDSTIVITERSRRTWWRRISEGAVERVADDGRGRAMLRWADVIPQICVELDTADLAMLLRADAGDSEAQNDISQCFSTAGKPKAALYWLQQAANQDNADAMQGLGRCYLNGDGAPRDENLGVMWIAKAAAHGHVIAQAQMNGLLHR